MISTRSLACSALGTLLLSTASLAQGVDLWTTPVSAGLPSFVYGAQFVEDQDGDGWPEIWGFGWTSNSSTVLKCAKLNGKTGQPQAFADVSPLPGCNSISTSDPRIIVCADLSGDGVEELALGTKGVDTISGLYRRGLAILDAVTGATLLHIEIGGPSGGVGGNFEIRLAQTQDLTGDGVGEILCSDFGWLCSTGAKGRVVAVDPVQGLIVPGYQIENLGSPPGTSGGTSGQSTSFGYSLAMGPDVDGDGTNEIYVSEPAAFSFGSGLVQLRSLRNPTVFAAHYGAYIFGLLGEYVRRVNDMDGDGEADCALSQNFIEAGEIRYVNSRTLSLIKEVIMPPGTPRALSLFDEVGDLNGDMLPEYFGVAYSILTFCPKRTWGLVDGATGEVSYSTEIDCVGNNLLVTAAAQTPDGALLQVIGHAAISGPFVYEGVLSAKAIYPPLLSPTATKCSGFSISWSGLWPNFQGSACTIELDGAEPMQLNFLVLSLNAMDWYGIPLPLDLASFGAPGCALAVAPDVLWPALADASGHAQRDLLLSNGGPLLYNLKAYAQWVGYSPSNPLSLATSDVLELMLLP